MSKATEATAAWLAGLKSTGAIGDDEFKVLEAAVAKPEVAEYVGSSQLRQDEFSRKMNDLSASHKTELAKIQAYERELADWRGGVEKNYSQIQAELQQARAEAARIAKVAQSYGLDESDLGTSVAPYTTPPGTPSEGGGSRPDLQNLAQEFLTRTDFDQLGYQYTMLPAELNDIVAEHQELFEGKNPRGMRQIFEKAVAEKRPLRDVWEEEFKVADRRAELEAKAREAEVTRRVEEQLTAWRTEHPEVRLPRPGARASVLEDKSLTAIPDAATDNLAADQNSSVRAAVAYWNQLDHAEG